MVWLKKLEIGFFVLLLLVPFVLLNYGKWLDTTEEPVKSDIIICLGGGTYHRITKSKELLNAGYAQKNLILLVGEDGEYNNRYIKKNYPNLPTVIDERPKNTVEEIRFIKQYMIEHNYKSALIVTDPTHSRRVSLLNSLISVEGDGALSFRIIDSGVEWWDKECYWCNKRSWGLVKSESIRILYTLIFARSIRYSKLPH